MVIRLREVIVLKRTQWHWKLPGESATENTKFSQRLTAGPDKGERSRA